LSRAPDETALHSGSDFEEWIAKVRAQVIIAEPDLVDLFDLFSNEALFAREWLQPATDRLPPGGSILEVGAGLALMTCQLVREGFTVSAIEPITDGFSSFARLQKLVIDFAEAEGISFTLLAQPVETFEEVDRYNLAFSINVMEHVENVEEAIRRVGRSLKPGGAYRFTCPNYRFPYEPHFNIPTLWSKPLTERLFHKSIYQSDRVSEPEAIWKSLNWINVPQIRRICAGIPGTAVSFNTSMTSDSLERLNTDVAFAKRRSGWMVVIIRGIAATGLHRLLTYLPAVFLPVIDCTVTASAMNSSRGG
jgi:SAM-dependent methyltransferase